jgi:hypothetical protein
MAEHRIGEPAHRGVLRSGQGSVDRLSVEGLHGSSLGKGLGESLTKTGRDQCRELLFVLVFSHLVSIPTA